MVMINQNRGSGETKVLSTKVINNEGKYGRVNSAITIEVKEYNGHKFIQLTQDKYPYGNKPASRTSLTLNSGNDNLKQSLIEAFEL